MNKGNGQDTNRPMYISIYVIRIKTGKGVSNVSNERNLRHESTEMNVLRTISLKFLVKIWDVHNEHLRFLLTHNIQYTQYEFLVLDVHTRSFAFLSRAYKTKVLESLIRVLQSLPCYHIPYIYIYIYIRGNCRSIRFARIFSVSS